MPAARAAVAEPSAAIPLTADRAGREASGETVPRSDAMASASRQRMTDAYFWLPGRSPWATRLHFLFSHSLPRGRQDCRCK